MQYENPLNEQAEKRCGKILSDKIWAGGGGGFKKLYEVVAVVNVWCGCSYKRLHEAEDLVWELIGEVITWWRNWMERVLGRFIYAYMAYKFWRDHRKRGTWRLGWGVGEGWDIGLGEAILNWSTKRPLSCQMIPGSVMY